MFGFFRKRPKEVVCYPAEYRVMVRLVDGGEVIIVAGYGDAALEEAMEFMDWFDKLDSEVFAGSTMAYRARNDIRISRHNVAVVRAWSRKGTDFYKDMGR
jgi:hypothetical protein